MPVPGLRERKKQQTRDAIIREALRLFRKRGFDHTTVAEIAEAADISPRTFFTYFETKEAVVFHDFDELVAGLRAHLEQREAGTSTFDGLRGWVEEWLETRGRRTRQELTRRELIRRTPALSAHEHVNRGAFEQLLAEHVAADLGVAPDALSPRMVSAAAVAALAALGDRDPDDLPERPMSLVDEAIAFLQGGLDVLRGQRRR